MTLAEVVEPTEIHRAEVVPVRTSSLVALAAPLDAIVEAQSTYHAVCAALLDENDIQVIGKKEFKKRSAWNKLAVAFGVSTTEVRTVHERDERGRIIRTECVVRAQAPNGRVSEGLGACDLYERCCDPETCRTPLTWPDGNFRHAHCETYPCKTAHFSNPQHDIPATAFTRASNRAKADLFGMGEVSAEEVSEGRAHFNDDGGSAGSGQSANQQQKNTEAMKGRIYAVTTKLKITVPDAIKKALTQEVDIDDLTFAQCRKVNDWLSGQEAAS